MYTYCCVQCRTTETCPSTVKHKEQPQYDRCLGLRPRLKQWSLLFTARSWGASRSNGTYTWCAAYMLRVCVGIIYVYMANCLAYFQPEDGGSALVRTAAQLISLYAERCEWLVSSTAMDLRGALLSSLLHAISYRGALLNTLLHATVYVYTQFAEWTGKK
jgi:hypothetical protein